VHPTSLLPQEAAAAITYGLLREIVVNQTRCGTFAVLLVVFTVTFVGCRRQPPQPPEPPATTAAPTEPATPDSPGVPQPAEAPAATPAETPAQVAPPAASLPAAKPEEIPKVDHTLEFTGSALEKPTVFTYTQLAQMELTPLYDVLMQKTHSADEMTSWQGIRLATLLQAAKVKEGSLRFELKAKDGFEMRSTSEVMASALLALKDGKGKWLAQLNEECPLRLVVPDKPGNYWIMNPISISVEPAE